MLTHKVTFIMSLMLVGHCLKLNRNIRELNIEALAVVWGSEKFHLYLVGTKFTIVTDHKASKSSTIPSSKCLQELSDGV
jgi:hypothetical protein